jgi:spore maturation protein CgeB
VLAPPRSNDGVTLPALKAFARVFALAPDCHTAGRYRSVWQQHFYAGLHAALPSVVLPAGIDFGWARPAARAPRGPSQDRRACAERLWDQIRAAHAGRGLDAVISYCFSSDVEPSLIERTIEMGVPWINFFCDSTYAFDLVESVARVASLKWFPERAAESRYRALGRPVLCRPYAVHASALTEATCETARHALGFVGLPTSNRVLRIASLLARGCPTAVRGHGWQRQPPPIASPIASPPRRRDPRERARLGERLLVRALLPVIGRGARPLADDEMVPFLSSCRVVLGLNEGRDLEGVYRSYLKLRDVEFPGHGCCVLTQHNEDVAHAFEVGREVLTFRTAREAAALVRRCVRHPASARAMGQAARLRVLREHTWSARLAELARAL